MFQAIRKWWNGLWEKEESPGPKITKEDIAKVKETIDEIRSGNFDRAKDTGATAHVDVRGELLPIGDLDFDGHMEPIPNPTGRTILPMVEMSFIAEPGIKPYVSDFSDLEETVAERLTDLKPVPVNLDELCPDTPVPAQRKPRRRGKRGGVKRNNRNKKK